MAHLLIKKAGGVCDWDAPNTEVVAEIIEKVLGEPPIDGIALVNQTL